MVRYGLMTPAKLKEFGERPATAEEASLGEKLCSDIDECRRRLVAAVEADIPFSPASDATAAILRAKDIATELLRVGATNRD